MALTVSNAASNSGITASATITATGINANAGDWLVVCVGASNNGTGGAASLSSTLTESTGNTCVNRGGIINISPGGVSEDGVTLGIWTIEVTTPISGGTITASFSPNCDERTILVQRVEPGSGETISLQDVGAGATGQASQASITASSVTSGDTIFGMCVLEQTTVTGTPDADTTNGNWSTQYAVVANPANALHMQYKTVSSTGAQTYNIGVVAAGREWAINYIILRSEVSGGVTGSLVVTEAPDVFAASGGPIVEGALAATEAADTFASSGAVGNVSVGTLAATEASDVFASSGGPIVSGSFAATEAQDAFAASGGAAITGSFAVTEAPDVFAATSESGPVVFSMTIGSINVRPVLTAGRVSVEPALKARVSIKPSR